MKRFTFIPGFIVSLLVLSIHLTAINYTLTFTASGVSSTIDHVVVNNLTQGITVTVPGGNALLLTDVTSVHQINVDQSLRIAPNPMLSKAKVSFHSAKGGLTNVSVAGLDGKVITELVVDLQAGDNTLMLSLPKGVFVLQINDQSTTHAAKVICHNNNPAGIEFSGMSAVNSSTKNSIHSPNKVNSATINLSYNAGDVLIFKAYAGNVVSILGDVVTSSKTVHFNMVECVDQEGKHYSTVTIGTQTWMAENLNTSRFRNNVALANKTNDATWGTTTAAAYSDYASPSSSNTFGKLYNGYAVTDINKLAPVGWLIPTDADWTILSEFLGGTNTAGKGLKDIGNTHWMTTNMDATNESGFTALPGGTKGNDGILSEVGSVGYWWSITDGDNANSRWNRELHNNSSILFRNSSNNNAGLSVRCVMDNSPQTPTATISSVTPTCFYNATVVIRGKDFSPTIADNIVKFGTIEGTVISATSTSLEVTTPNLGNATTVDITVTTAGGISNAKSIAVDFDLNKVATFDWTTHTVKPGVTYKTGQFTLFGSAQRRIFILDVTLNASNSLGIGFSTSNATTVAMCNNYNAIAGINAGYFPMSGAVDKDPYIRINGVTVQAGHSNVTTFFNNAALIIHNNVAQVRKIPGSHKNLNSVTAQIPVAEAENIIACGPILITSNKLENQDLTKSHNTSKAARTGLGVSADGKRVFMVVVDTGGGFTGVTTPELGKILQALGAVDAMNFDGGGSSTMFVKNQGASGRVNFPNGGTTQRAIKSVIYVK